RGPRGRRGPERLPCRGPPEMRHAVDVVAPRERIAVVTEPAGERARELRESIDQIYDPDGLGNGRTLDLVRHVEKKPTSPPISASVASRKGFRQRGQMRRRSPYGRTNRRKSRVASRQSRAYSRADSSVTGDSANSRNLCWRPRSRMPAVYGTGRTSYARPRL